MFQQTQQIEDHVTSSVIKAGPSFGQSFAGILGAFWGITRNVTSAAAGVFHTFVETGAVNQRTPDAFWWNAPDHTKDLFN